MQRSGSRLWEWVKEEGEERSGGEMKKGHGQSKDPLNYPLKYLDLDP